MIDAAQDAAQRLLGDVGTRLEHTRLVAQQAAEASAALESPWPRAVQAAAWLHDIGYSRLVVASGLHSLDGARWARSESFNEQVCSLVAWHTGAVFEARQRGLEACLRIEFEEPPALALDVLTWADLTSSPTGEPVLAGARLEEILSRYHPDSHVHRAISAAASQLHTLVERVEQLRGASYA